MELTAYDVVTFLVFVGAVVGISLYAGRHEKSGKDYFLAGRSLTWPFIGFSLIASNISTEHFVGMAGSAFGRVGLAIASYEWMSAITLVFVAWWLLPKFLKAGIYTMPEYLEYRYDSGTRTIMAVFLLAAYVIVFLATVVYSGAMAVITIFNIPAMFQDWFSLAPADATFWALVASIWAIGIIAASVTIYGGLKSVVWADLIQGSGLLLGGGMVAVVALLAIGNNNLFEGIKTFGAAQAGKLHTVLPWNDADVPWLAVFIGGLWIPNIFYWGLNQFITQRTLGAKNLAEGQKGIFFAAWLKLLVPFVIVMPGIMAFHLYGQGANPAVTNGDQAYSYLIRVLLPPHLRGAMFAALCGAVISSFNSGLNSASTILTVDLYEKFINPKASQKRILAIGRIATACVLVVACLWAPIITKFSGVFRYIQEIWGFITPGIVAAFLVGMVVKKAPALAAKTAMITGMGLYALFRVPGWVLKAPVEAGEIAKGTFWHTIYRFSTMAFLHHMGIIFLILAAIMLIITWRKPLMVPRTMPVSELNVTPYRYQYLAGGITIAATAVLYFIFW
jgi:SSS family solute:Na+ symporter